MDLSQNEIIQLNSSLGVTEEELKDKSLEQIAKDHHTEGQMTEDGWVDADGTLTPRHKKEPRMGMTQFDEYLIASHCYLHPEEAEEFVKEKLANPTKKNHKEYFEGLGLERVN